jgi:hypothetical protein
LDEHNPYSPPKSAETRSYQIGDGGDRGTTTILVAWFAVFVVNLIVPLLFGLMVTTSGGRIGMAIAVIVFFAAGCWICANFRKIGNLLIIGGIPIGLSQVLPILQMFSGLVGNAICHALRLMDEFGETPKELGGFLVTLITGAILMTASAGSGFVIQRFVLDRWRARHTESGKSGTADEGLD